MGLPLDYTVTVTEHRLYLTLLSPSTNLPHDCATEIPPRTLGDWHLLYEDLTVTVYLTFPNSLYVLTRASLGRGLHEDYLFLFL